MKLSCDVINDLLPLYYDEVCSEETKKIVEEHLKECETCRNLMGKMGKEYCIPQKELDETIFFKDIQQQLKKRETRFAVLVVCFICLAWLGLHIANTYKFISVGASSFQISEVSHLEDKAIGFYIKVCDGKDVNFVKAENADENGIVYIHGKRSLLEDSIDDSDSYGYHEQYFYYNADKYNQWLSGLDQTANEDLTYITEVRFGTEDDYILLWKEGMELPKASEMMEDDYGRGIRP